MYAVYVTFAAPEAGQPIQTVDALLRTAQDISRCTKCDEAGYAVEHIKPMERGAGREVLVVGVEPGRTEVKTARAFSGPAGTNLMKWLVEAGVGSNTDDVFRRCYLTSLCKCRILDEKNFAGAVRNCFPFLQRQIAEVAPRICLTLGAAPLRHVFSFRGSMDDVVGRAWTEAELTGSLIRLMPESCTIIPLPHPSPANNAWLAAHAGLLEQGLAALRDAL